MNIAIIGTGNVGGALATRWAQYGHHIYLGVQNTNSFKGQHLIEHPNIQALTIAQAVAHCNAVLMATPPTAVFNIIESMGKVENKIIIDATNAVRMAPDPYPTAYHALVDLTSAKIVKCFNTTGFENMLNPVYHQEGIDLFMAGDDADAKQLALQLALDAGFGNCYDFGKADKVELLEKFALSWINLAIMQGHGRDIAFRLVKRQ